jgi:hypothetical protein
MEFFENELCYFLKIWMLVGEDVNYRSLLLLVSTPTACRNKKIFYKMSTTNIF